MSETQTLTEFLDGARAWLDANAVRRSPATHARWGEGSDRVSLFRDASVEEENDQAEAARDWQRRKFDAGFGAISWSVEYGGAGLSAEYEQAFRRLEAEYVTPVAAEVIVGSASMLASTILALGSPAQRERWIRSLRRSEEVCCQLFSEPGAGSDLGAISLRAARDGDGWVLNGQKVWTSGAQFADVGLAIARTDTDAPRQRAFTAFLVPMRGPGVRVRPLRQMTGGSSFNEVFFDDVSVADDDRLGEVGGGWGAMMTTLGFERAGVADGLAFSGSELVDRLVMTARHYGRDRDPEVRQRLAELYSRNRMRRWLVERAAATVRAGGVPGPEGSLRKLAYTRELRAAGDLAGLILGTAMVADTGAWGTFAWSALVCGAPGFRLAGGTDEIQKNTIAERVLGLPKEPR